MASTPRRTTPTTIRCGKQAAVRLDRVAADGGIFNSAQPVTLQARVAISRTGRSATPRCHGPRAGRRVGTGQLLEKVLSVARTYHPDRD